MRFAVLLLFAGVLGACGPAKAPSPPTQHPAGIHLGVDPSQPSGVVCAPGARYDPGSGCTAEVRGAVLALRQAIDHDLLRVIHAQYFVDRQLVMETNDPELLTSDGYSVALLGSSTGPHELHVKLILRGEGSGLFAYLREYRFETRSTHVAQLRDPGLLITITSYEKGGVMTPVEKRPAIAYRESPLFVRGAASR